LARNGAHALGPHEVREREGGSNSNEARCAVQANAYSGCISGYYHGEAFGFIVFPAGYTPWSDGWIYSANVYIACP
jgi:hypothetical protein